MNGNPYRNESKQQAKMQLDIETECIESLWPAYNHKVLDRFKAN